MSTREAVRVSLAMAAVGRLHKRLGLDPISELPGCWEVQVDDRWWFAVNGLRYDAPCSRDILVPPKHLVVTWRQFPVATCSRYSGDWVNRPGVTEDDFIAAVRRFT
jgi:hypothetical protein